MDNSKTPPVNILEQVTPDSQWRRSLPMRQFIDETIFASPLPVINSTRCDSLKPGENDVARTLPTEQTLPAANRDDTTCLSENIFDMSDLSGDQMFLNLKPKVPDNAAVQDITSPREVEIKTTQLVQNSPSTQPSSAENTPSQSEVFAATNKQTIRLSQPTTASSDISKLKTTPQSATGSDLSDASRRLSRIPVPRRLSGSFSSSKRVSSQSDTLCESQSNNSSSKTFEVNPDKVEIDSKTFTSPPQPPTSLTDAADPAELTLADYLCPVEVEAIEGEEQNDTTITNEDTAGSESIEPLTATAAAAATFSGSRTLPSSQTYSLEKTYSKTTVSSGGDNSAVSHSGRILGHVSSVNLMDCNTPDVSAADTNKAATRKVNDRSSHEMSRLLYVSSNSSYTEAAALKITETPAHHSPVATDQGGHACVDGAVQASSAELPEDKNHHLESPASADQSLPHIDSQTTQGDGEKLQHEEHITMLVGIIGDAVETPASADKFVESAPSSPVNLYDTAAVSSVANHSATLVSEIIAPSSPTSSPLQTHHSHSNASLSQAGLSVSQTQASSPPGHPMELMVISVTEPHGINISEGEVKENLRPVSPICFIANDGASSDEMDARSESSMSVYSELSESSKPVYSKSLLDVLMSGDNKAILSALNKNVTTMPGEKSALKAVSHVLNVPSHNTRSLANIPDPRLTLTKDSRPTSSKLSSPPSDTASSRPADSFFDVDTNQTSNSPSDTTITDTHYHKAEGMTFSESVMFGEGSALSSLQSSPTISRRSASELPRQSQAYPDILRSFIRHKLESSTAADEDTLTEQSCVSSETAAGPVQDPAADVPRANLNSSAPVAYDSESDTCDNGGKAVHESSSNQVSLEVSSAAEVEVAEVEEATKAVMSSRASSKSSYIPVKSKHKTSEADNAPPSPPQPTVLVTQTDNSARAAEFTVGDADDIAVAKRQQNLSMSPQRDVNQTSRGVITPGNSPEFSQQTTMFDPVTPGQPVCESSHIHSQVSHRPDSPSERSTQYLPLGTLAAMAAARQHQPMSVSLPAMASDEMKHFDSSAIRSSPKIDHINQWLSNQCAGGGDYVSGTEPASIQLCNDTTRLTNHKSLLSDRVSPQHPRHKNVVCEPPAEAVTSLDLCPPDNSHSFANQTATTYGYQSEVISLCHNEDTTLHNADQSAVMAGCRSNTQSPNHSASTQSSSSLSQKSKIEVPSTHHFPLIHSTMTHIHLEVPVTNLTSRWLNVSMKISEHRINGRIASTHLHYRQCDDVLKPSITDRLPIIIHSCTPGRHEVTLAISVKDELITHYTILGLELEAPNVQLVDNSDGLLDFGVVPYSCVKKVPLTLTNKGNVTVSLVVRIVPERDMRGVLELVTGPLMSAVPCKDPLSCKLTLSGYQDACDDEHTQSVYILFKAPVRHSNAGSPETVCKQIVVYLASAVSGEPLLSVKAQAICGYANLQFPAKFHSFEMRCKPQADAVEEIPIRNSGDVPIDVSVSLSNKDNFVVTPDSLHIKPDQYKSVRLAFLSSTMSAIDNCAHCTLSATIEPQGTSYDVEVRGSVEPPSSIPAHISQLRTNALKLNAPSGEKPKIKMTPQAIKFGGVELSEKRFVVVRIQNHYDQPVKVMMDIDQSEYQIAVSSADCSVDKYYSAKEFILPVCRSETHFYDVRIVYQPRKLGYTPARLKCMFPEKGIRSRTPIYGYGGPSLVQPVLDLHPTVDEYAIQVGELANRHSIQHKFFLRNVGYHKAFVLTKCYGDSGCSEKLESTRISVEPSSLVISPADAMRVTVNMAITERERVLAESGCKVIATIRVIYVDQLLRQLLQRNVALSPELKEAHILPFLSVHEEDSCDLELPLPGEASNVRHFVYNVKSFTIHVCAKRPSSINTKVSAAHPSTRYAQVHPQTSSTSSAALAMLDSSKQPLSMEHAGLEVTTKSLTFRTKLNESQELVADLRNRSTEDLEVQVSRLAKPFKCKTRNCTLRATPNIADRLVVERGTEENFAYNLHHPVKDYGKVQ